VTNKHVVAGSIQGILRLHEHNGAGDPIGGSSIRVVLDDFERRWIMHPDPDIDLCIMPISGIMQQLEAQGSKPFVLSPDESLIPSQTFLESLLPIEDIVMVGYPNGIWDTANNMPIVRRGITATRPGLRYNGRDEFIIDAAVYPGSSGSPVFLYNQGSYADRQGNINLGSRVFLLGVVYKVFLHTAQGKIVVQDIPTQNVPLAVTGVPNNLGLVMWAARLKDFTPIVQSRRD
jgi:hypothetical protein